MKNSELDARIGFKGFVILLRDEYRTMSKQPDDWILTLRVFSTGVWYEKLAASWQHSIEAEY